MSARLTVDVHDADDLDDSHEQNGGRHGELVKQVDDVRTSLLARLWSVREFGKGIERCKPYIGHGGHGCDEANRD